MENYEIRILRWDGLPGLITERQYLNTAAAITAGKLLACGRRFEVWTDDCCVYPPRRLGTSESQSPSAA